MNDDKSNGTWANCKGRPTGADSWASNFVEVFSNIDNGVEIIQFEPKKWVELPDCTGAADEIPLEAAIANASKATCKKRPAGAGGAAAGNTTASSNSTAAANTTADASADASANATATSFVQLFKSAELGEVQVLQYKAGMAPKTKTEKNKWIELPDCKGETGEIELLPENENDTTATCKNRPAGSKDYGSAPALVQIYKSNEIGDIQVIQLEKSTKGFDDLPTCTGKSGEVALDDNADNYRTATCK